MIASLSYHGLPIKTRVGQRTGLPEGERGAPAASQAVPGQYVLLRFNGAPSGSARAAPICHVGSSTDIWARQSGVQCTAAERGSRFGPVSWGGALQPNASLCRTKCRGRNREQTA